MNVSRALANLAVRIAPADRRDWTEALRAELTEVPAGERASFAAGALMTAVRLRAADPAFVLLAARWGLAAAALVWALLHLRLGLKLYRVDPSLPALLASAAGVVFALGALVTAFAGLRFTFVLGAPVLVLLTVYTGGAALLMPDSPNRAFYNALALEDVFALLTAVLVAAGARRYAASRARPAG